MGEKSMTPEQLAVVLDRVRRCREEGREPVAWGKPRARTPEEKAAKLRAWHRKWAIDHGLDPDEYPRQRRKPPRKIRKTDAKKKLERMMRDNGWL